MGGARESAPDVVVGLSEASDPSLFGAKAANLAVAAAHGIAVPPAAALPWTLADALAGGDRAAAGAVASGCASLGAPLVVRSSAIGEDSAGASFAGQHLSVLNVPDARAVVDAVVSVWRSARSDAALAYRQRLGLGTTPRMAVIVQRLVDADVAGVLFDGNPVTGADEVVIESAWGLGEAVVAGTVTPDLFRLGEAGDVRQRRVGTKDVELRAPVDGGTTARPVAADRARAPSLGDDQLAELFALARRCREVFGGSQDLEWAYEGPTLWLLQRRPVTASASR